MKLNFESAIFNTDSSSRFGMLFFNIGGFPTLIIVKQEVHGDLWQFKVWKRKILAQITSLTYSQEYIHIRHQESHGGIQNSRLPK